MVKQSIFYEHSIHDFKYESKLHETYKICLCTQENKDRYRTPLHSLKWKLKYISACFLCTVKQCNKRICRWIFSEETEKRNFSGTVSKNRLK